MLKYVYDIGSIRLACFGFKVMISYLYDDEVSIGGLDIVGITFGLNLDPIFQPVNLKFKPTIILGCGFTYVGRWTLFIGVKHSSCVGSSECPLALVIPVKSTRVGGVVVVKQTLYLTQNRICDFITTATFKIFI